MTQPPIDHGFDPDCLDALLQQALPNLAGPMTLQRIAVQRDAGAPTSGVERPRVWLQNQLHHVGIRPGPRD